jgi:light-regulated signal transduction histidine kinase (bacteriophytochrome)
MAKNDKDLEFALTMYKSQLQDTLTLIGKAILKDLREVLEANDEEEHMSIIKHLMINPFDQISEMCAYMSEEYINFKNSTETQDNLKRIMMKVENNPDLLDDLMNAEPEEVERLIKSLKDTDSDGGNLQ